MKYRDSPETLPFTAVQHHLFLECTVLGASPWRGSAGRTTLTRLVYNTVHILSPVFSCTPSENNIMHEGTCRTHVDLSLIHI